MRIRQHPLAGDAATAARAHPATELNEPRPTADERQGSPWRLFLYTRLDAGGARRQRIEFAIDARARLPHLPFDLFGVCRDGFAGLCVDLSCIHAMFS